MSYGDDEQFTPLVARDYGSRARGISDTASDYDVFFIFAQNPATYVVGNETDVYTKTVPAAENELEREIELHGWNLQKFLGPDGVAGSNPTAVEFCASFEQYFVHGDCNFDIYRLCQHINASFKPYALMQHYRSMAANNYRKYIENGYKFADGYGWADVMDYLFNDISWRHISDNATDNLQVDEQESEIGPIETELCGKIVWNDIYLSKMQTDELVADGVLESTTVEPTVKRYLNVAKALLGAKYVEETHNRPLLNVPALLERVNAFCDMHQNVYTDIQRLIELKTDGHGEMHTFPDALSLWVDNELDRDIDPEGHVDRQPETETVQQIGQEIVEAVY
jgi:predicted nucleotidyltransferase